MSRPPVLTVESNESVWRKTFVFQSFTVFAAPFTSVDNSSEVMSEQDTKARLAQELNKARKLLLAASVKPFWKEIPLEKRLDLARTLAKDENINYLAAQIQLAKPIANEIPPWDDDRDLHEWLELEAEAVRAERARHERAAAQATARLREAERRYEQYVISKQQEEAAVDAKSTQSRKSETTGNPRQDSSATCALRSSARIRRSLSKDDLSRKGCNTIGDNRKSTTGSPGLRRRPSFVADTSQSQIEIHMTCSNCRVNNEAIINTQDLAAIAQPLDDLALNNVVTSTPHVGQRVRERLFNENTVETAISRRRSSCVHFEDEKIIMLNKDRTFQIGTSEDGVEKENLNPHQIERHRRLAMDDVGDGPEEAVNRTVVKADSSRDSLTNKPADITTVVRKAKATIVKDRNLQKSDTRSAQTVGVKSAVPRIAQPRIGGPARSRLATAGPVAAIGQDRPPTRNPATGSTTSRIGFVKPVLPSKTSALPGATSNRRPFGSTGTRDVPSTGFTRSGPGAKPSKPATGPNRAPQIGKRS
ncbi:uncharacterized protein LOC111245375 isoform X2 [Varroa destructor]|nr:uncharacterized protein LOC111245375 isoform X2 [Varroa destructor]XP_022649386.1 uncharacterized protein LOC111245375 isoform X2 [Varroa destructor]XP_022649387.1 uncharacterized protein LOC111245375 isoform X2 [Varroa destructor]